MSFLGRLLSRARPESRRGGALASVAFGPVGSSSWSVNAAYAENLATVTACINAVASTIATLPARVYRTEGGAHKVEALSHPVSRLIRAPNPHQSWPDWCEMTLGQALLHGNGVSVIEHDGAGRPIALRPVPWQNLQVSLLASGRLAYDVSAFIAPWGGTGTPRRYLDDEVFHLRDRSDDGLVGRSRISRVPEVVANAASLQAHSSSVWSNGASLRGYIVHPGRLNAEARKNLATDFAANYGGAGQAGKTPVLDEGMSFTPLSMSPEDSEVLQSRRFSVEEICRVFQVPPPIVQDYSHGTFTNSEQAAKWFAQVTLTPWAAKLEAEFSRSVFVDDTARLEIDLTGLVRGDYAQRWASYATAIQNGILTIDEIREMEGFDPLAGAAPEPAIEGAS